MLWMPEPFRPAVEKKSKTRCGENSVSPWRRSVASLHFLNGLKQLVTSFFRRKIRQLSDTSYLQQLVTQNLRIAGAVSYELLHVDQRLFENLIKIWFRVDSMVPMLSASVA